MTKLSTMLENLLTIIDRDTEGNLCDAAQDEQESLPAGIEFPCHGIGCDDCMFMDPNKDRDRLLQLIKTVELIDHG